jgi:hypothetical protein
MFIYSIIIIIYRYEGVSVNCHLHDNHNRTGDGNVLLDTAPKRSTLTRAHLSNGNMNDTEQLQHTPQYKKVELN